MEETFTVFTYKGKSYVVDSGGGVYAFDYGAQTIVGLDKPPVAKAANGGYIKSFEPGGKVSGPGTSTSDSIRPPDHRLTLTVGDWIQLLGILGALYELYVPDQATCGQCAPWARVMSASAPRWLACAANMLGYCLRAICTASCIFWANAADCRLSSSADNDNKRGCIIGQRGIKSSMSSESIRG